MKCLKFKAWMVENGIHQQEIADLIGVGLANTNAKINGRQNFTLDQVKAITSHYGISADIFLENALN